MEVHMKACFKCGKEQPLSEFYKHKEMADGHLNKCKSCTKKDTRNRRFGDKREEVLKYDRERAHLLHRKENHKRVTSKWEKKFPERRYASGVVAHALKAGKIQKLPCLICGGKSEAHHPDYSRPLDVVWLCSAHHKQAHALVRR
jgi:transcription elongation factor Elf1